MDGSDRIALAAQRLRAAAAGVDAALKVLDARTPELEAAMLEFSDQWSQIKGQVDDLADDLSYGGSI